MRKRIACWRGDTEPVMSYLIRYEKTALMNSTSIGGIHGYGSVIVCMVALLSFGAHPADLPPVEFEKKPGRLEISIGGKPFATYVYRDDAIPRPYWADLRAPNGVRVTREHPPSEAKYADHPTMHPGIWMSFGDINGYDFWRNKARTRNVRFIQEPANAPGMGIFQVENAYESSEGALLCEASSTYTIRVSELGYFIEWQSEFHATGQDVIFGDQEEMGLGFRVAMPLSVNHGKGEIRNDAGGRNEAGIWGKTARWCDYGAVVGDQRLGIAVFPHPENFRKSWMHARDYGFLAANPFGRSAMTGGEESAVRVRRGSSLTLKFGLFIYSVPAIEGPPITEAYEFYVGSEP